MLKLLLGQNGDMVFDLDCDQITTLINESLLTRTSIDHSNVVTDSVFNNNATS